MLLTIQSQHLRNCYSYNGSNIHFDCLVYCYKSRDTLEIPSNLPKWILFGSAHSTIVVFFIWDIQLNWNHMMIVFPTKPTKDDYILELILRGGEISISIKNLKEYIGFPTLWRSDGDFQSNSPLPSSNPLLNCFQQFPCDQSCSMYLISRYYTKSSTNWVPTSFFTFKLYRKIICKVTVSLN